VQASNFNKTKKDASDIFGEGAERVRYTDPESGGTIEVVTKKDGSTSVLELAVPEEFRGKGIGQSLQKQAMDDFPNLGGQVSSKAAATTAYRLGRRPVGNPDATLDDVFKMINENSSVNLVSKESNNISEALFLINFILLRTTALRDKFFNLLSDNLP
jgi:predicted GNAT family acetyltransferase